MAIRRRKLKNLKVEYISYVDKAANLRSFYLTKRYEEEKHKPDFQMNVKLICNADNEEKKVYGIVYAPNTVDAHGDWTDEKTLEKAAHQFMLDYQKIDSMHNLEEGAGKVIESFIAPTDFVVNNETITKGTWVIATQATDEVWERIKKGEITGYSLYGTAEAEYEKMNLLEIIKALLQGKTLTIENPMEVTMDEELKKALTNLLELSETVKKMDGNIVSMQEVLAKGKDVLDKFADLKVEEIEKSFNTKIDEKLVELNKKLDSIIEAISTDTTAKTANNKQEQEEVTAYKSSIL